jgi:aminoglycoside 6'-N-acetyltransferase
VTNTRTGINANPANDAQRGDRPADGVDHIPAGLLQDYLHTDYPEQDACCGVPNAVGIDYLLGGLHRRKGLGRRVLSDFAALLLDLRPDVESCVAAPARSNRASWRALEYAGFVRRGECEPPDEPPAYVYVAARTA